MVFNKMDRLQRRLRTERPEPFAGKISARRCDFCDNGRRHCQLCSRKSGRQLRPTREFLELRVPHERAAVIARLHEVGQVIERRYNGRTARFKARIPPHHHDEFAPFIVREAQAVS